MTRTVLLNCPIKAEIRAVDSQSDLTICYSYDDDNDDDMMMMMMMIIIIIIILIILNIVIRKV